MKEKKFELYEDGSGRLFLFEVADGGGAVWCCSYDPHEVEQGYDGAERAGLDWAGAMVQGLDPIAEGWDGLTGDGAEGLRRECRDAGELVAWSEWAGSWPLGMRVPRMGEAGTRAAVAAGAAVRCPACGDVVPCEVRADWGAFWPEACPACGGEIGAQG